MTITAEQIARALGRGKETKTSDGGWKTLCPGHDDKMPSMTVTDKRGKILVKCQSGCTQDHVIKCLQEQDLWPKAEKKRASWKPIRPVPENAPGVTSEDMAHYKMGKPSRYWAYYELDGQLIGYILRFDTAPGEKTLLPLSYCESDAGEFGWNFKSFDKPRPLYNLKELATDKHKPVALFEGEKASDKASELFKTHICMSWPGGSNAVKFADFEVLAGRDVVLWPDNDEPGRKAMTLAAEIISTYNIKSVKIVEVPETLPKGWDVADDTPEGVTLDLVNMLLTAKEFMPQGESIINELNKKYAFVLVGDKAAVLREMPDATSGKTSLTYLAPSAFSQFFSNHVVQVGKAEVPAGSYWLTHPDRRTYEGVIFMPAKETPQFYNLWRGFSVEPDQTGDWSIFRDHLLENICQNDETLFQWVFGWFAQMMQKPAKKVGTSLSLRGTQGTGKTIIGKVFGHLIRQHYTLVDDPRYVLGNFNSHLASTLLLHSDEGFWGGNPQYVGKLKSMVTSETQRIEPKGKDTFEVQNFMRLLITTNQDWVVPAGYEERRFAVLDVGRGREQDRPYFKSMLRQLSQGGYSGLLHDLLEFDLSKVDVGAIPMTKALQDQKEMSMSATARFWFTCLMDGDIIAGLGWPDDVMSNRLYEVFIETTQQWGIRHRPHQNEFFKELRKIAPPDSLGRVRKLISGKRVWCLTLPPLDKARRFFDGMNNSRYDWPNDDVVEEKKPALVDEEIPF